MIEEKMKAGHASELMAAAVAVIKHWDTPALEDVRPTAHYINLLRAAVENALRNNP